MHKKVREYREYVNINVYTSGSLETRCWSCAEEPICDDKKVCVGSFSILSGFLSFSPSRSSLSLSLSLSVIDCEDPLFLRKL